MLKIESDSGTESENGSGGDVEIPFDPEKIVVRTRNVVIDQVVSRINHGEIDLAPDFQRMPGIWDCTRQSRFIESLLLRIPIPVFYVSADWEDNWHVVDGVQRISSFYSYISGKFELAHLEYMTDLNEKTFCDLPRSMQRRICETQLVINVIERETSEEVMFNIFRRINTGGMPLNSQEIRHAVNPGPVRAYLKRLAETDEFRKATNYEIKPERMGDRECVLRFLAFHIGPWERYKIGNLDGYLVSAMAKINEMSEMEREDLVCDFKKAMNASIAVFGKNAFRKRYEICNPAHRPINKALFEAWSVGFARRSQGQLNMLFEKREDVVRQFVELMTTDEKFHDSISASTGSVARVKLRFEMIDKLIGKHSADA